MLCKALLDLQHDLLLKQLLLSLLNFGRFGLFGWSSPLVSLIDHLDSKVFNREREVQRVAGLLRGRLDVELIPI